MTAEFAGLLREMAREEAVEQRVRRVLHVDQPRQSGSARERGDNPYTLTVSAGVLVAGLVLSEVSGTSHVVRTVVSFLAGSGR